VIQKCELVEKWRRIWRNSWRMGPTATVSFEQQTPAANTVGFASSLVIAPEQEKVVHGVSGHSLIRTAASSCQHP